MGNNELREWMNYNYTTRQIGDKLVVMIGNIIGSTEFIPENGSEPGPNTFKDPFLIMRGKHIRSEEVAIKRLLDYMHFQYYDFLLKIYREQQIDKLL